LNFSDAHDEKAGLDREGKQGEIGGIPGASPDWAVAAWVCCASEGAKVWSQSSGSLALKPLFIPSRLSH
jgi:hypothetical protein